MKYLILFSVLVGSACAPVTPSCQTGQLLGSDNQCYSCNYGTPEYASGEFGYCSTLSAGGVACCSTAYNFGSVTCYPNEPWLCSDLLCHTSDLGACIYRP
jgi:hypothetical protein